jgi:hypothetical protein
MEEQANTEESNEKEKGNVFAVSFRSNKALSNKIISNGEKSYIPPTTYISAVLKLLDDKNLLLPLQDIHGKLAMFKGKDADVH